MKIKFKKLHPEAIVPTRQKLGDVGYDLVAINEKSYLPPTGPYTEYDTGIAVEIPEGYVGLVFQRSSVTTKTGLMLGNATGVIDPNYRGSIKFQFRNLTGYGKKYKVGDRIGQLLIIPAMDVEYEEVSELSETTRNEEGFGSSGD